MGESSQKVQISSHKRPVNICYLECWRSVGENGEEGNWRVKNKTELKYLAIIYKMLCKQLKLVRFKVV